MDCNYECVVASRSSSSIDDVFASICEMWRLISSWHASIQLIYSLILCEE